MPAERQLTFAPHGHVLTNTGVWSAGGQWIAYDVRSDPAGSVFDGARIERVHVESGEVQILYESRNGACCGVVTCSPVEDKVAFILGPEHPTPDWSYGQAKRQGVVVDCRRLGIATNLEARDLVAPFTPGALRGGSHVHVFSGDGQWVSFTYNDAVLERFGDRPAADHDIDQRNVGVAVPCGPVSVLRTNPRNHAGSHFAVLVTRTTAVPRPGSDDIRRAFEDAWIGTNGYVRPDGSRQRRAIAFQGEVLAGDGAAISEVFLADIPDDVTTAGDGPLQGTATRRPAPPRGTGQRRLTRTESRRHPGIQGPRHWLRSSPDGTRIAFLMRDDRGTAQLWTISPNGGEPQQVSDNPYDIASAFTWMPDGRRIAHVMDGSVCITDIPTGKTSRLTSRPDDPADAPRPEACVLSPDGGRVAYVRNIKSGGSRGNQVLVADAR